MEIGVLGPLEVTGEQGLVRLEAHKQRRLLAALVARAGEACSTDVLIDALWGESPPSSAPKLLQIYVSRLRKGLPSPEKIETSDAGYRLELDGVSIDAARFERLLNEGRAVLRQDNPALGASLLAKALDLWRGPAYADFRYEDFARTEAERLEELRQVANEEHIEAQLSLGHHDDLVSEVIALANRHPLRERLQAQAMLALYLCGRQSEALDFYTSVRERLREELGLEPAPQLRILQRRILQQDPSLLVPAHRDQSHTKLPVSPTSLLGRERELAELGALLVRDDTRLVVLTGAGGSGKTRLAVEAARRCTSSFANGAAFVSLGPLRDPRLIVGEISRVLGIRETPGADPFETLADQLQFQELLLVVDNAEHLRAATSVFVDLINRAARLTILITSRAVLHLSGEHVYPVEPLDDEAAFALFVERASEANARFTLSAKDEDGVRRICERLDRLPLAIELAASHARVLSPSELLARLDPRLPLLTGGARDLPARQRTLRATLEWTFDLLDDREARDLTRLAVFAGSCTLEAADAVFGTTVERVSALIDHTLLRRIETDAGARYAMLETVREYALDRLQTREGIDGPRRMHADYYLRLAERSVDENLGRRAAFFDSIDVELDNLREAFRWMQDREPAMALRLAAALSGFWIYRDRLVEGRRWLEDVLGPPHPSSHDLAIVTADLARILFALGELGAVEEWVDRALELAETLELPDVLSEALSTLGLLLDATGRYDDAQAHFERALSIARNHDLVRSQVRTLYNLANMMDEQDDHLRARTFDLQGLELSRKAGLGGERYLGNLIWRDLMLGDWDAALALCDELGSAPMPGRLGEAVGAPWIQVQRGEIDEARRQLEARWHLNRAEDVWARVCDAIAEAVVLRAEQRPDEALEAAESALTAFLAPRYDAWKMAWVEAIEAAFALDDVDRVREFVDAWSRLSASNRTPFGKAQHARFAARLSIRLGETAGVESALGEATATFRGLSMPFYVAVGLLEHAEWLTERGYGDEATPLLAEAREIFKRLKAIPWLERASQSRAEQQLDRPTESLI